MQRDRLSDECRVDEHFSPQIGLEEVSSADAQVIGETVGDELRFGTFTQLGVRTSSALRQAVVDGRRFRTGPLSTNCLAYSANGRPTTSVAGGY